MRRTVCRACESNELEEFLHLGNMALAGGFLPSADSMATEMTYPLDVHVCRACGLVQILEVIDPEILFQNYSFASSTVGPLIQHFENYAQWLKDSLNPEVVVEFGCNDGILLGPLNRRGVCTVGVDISENITEIGRTNGLDIVTGYFNMDTAAAIEARIGKADVVTGSNAFAHNDKPELILKAAKRILKPNGHLCLEMMYAGDLLELYQWDTLYHEHLTFYSLTSVDVLLRRFGFHVVHAERLPMHGGSLRVVAACNPDESARPTVTELLAYENKMRLAEAETWATFGRHVVRKIQVVRDTVGRLSQRSRIWGYGAAGKATLWVNACQMGYLEGIVDSSPLRAGKLMPGTHTPIVFPDELKKNPPDYIFVTAWNYADLIRSKENWFDGIWITPLSDLRFF